MIRRRIIAGVILLAAVAVAVPFAPSVWRKVAYRQHHTLDSVVVLVRRSSWLPGESEVFPDQLCPRCGGREHDRCWSRPRLPFDAPILVFVEEQVFGVPRSFRCTCTDPSHDGDSE